VQQLPCKSLVIVGARIVRDELYHSLMLRQSDWESAGISSVDCIGDSLAPGAIAHAVHSGHRFARELDQAAGSEIYRRDSPIVESPPLLYKEGHVGARAR
jgi:dimethylamine/trimethylamine dehydrogenase